MKSWRRGEGGDRKGETSIFSCFLTIETALNCATIPIDDQRTQDAFVALDASNSVLHFSRLGEGRDLFAL